MPRPFLTAQWRYLAMLNYRIDPAVLTRYVPVGTELDLWEGHALVSVVGFRFLDTRVLGLRIPLHRSFDEINLRFYVHRAAADGPRRGVTFIREIVPRRAIALVARAAYNEPYVTCAMRSIAPAAPDAASPGRVEYAWRDAGRWHTLRVGVQGAPAPAGAGSEAEFITEHFWGYTSQRDGGTIEYEVRHPPWRVWTATESSLDGDVAGFYGAAFGDALRAAPCSAFLAEGSAVSVYSPVRIAV